MRLDRYFVDCTIDGLDKVTTCVNDIKSTQIISDFNNLKELKAAKKEAKARLKKLEKEIVKAAAEVYNLNRRIPLAEDVKEVIDGIPVGFKKSGESKRTDDLQWTRGTWFVVSEYGTCEARIYQLCNMFNIETKVSGRFGIDGQCQCHWLNIPKLSFAMKVAKAAVVYLNNKPNIKDHSWIKEVFCSSCYDTMVPISNEPNGEHLCERCFNIKDVIL